MRILALTEATAKKILSARRRSDPAAEGVAAKIVADVRRRGDAALFYWARRLDRISLTPKTLWIPSRQRHAALREAPRALRTAIDHAARNIRRVAQQQRPRSWTIAVEPGVRVGQRVTPLDIIGCYVPGGRF